MKYKTSELEGEELDEAVALALGWKPIGGYWWEPGTIEKDGGLALPDGRGSKCMRRVAMYSRDWADGGPIIEREKITVVDDQGVAEEGFDAMIDAHGEGPYVVGNPMCSGKTYLVAAMRVFVAAKLGDEVDL